MKCRRIMLENGYLHIPVKVGAPKSTLQIWLGDVLLREFSVELGDGDGTQHYFFLDLQAFAGKTVCLMLPNPQKGAEDSLDRIIEGGEPIAGDDLYPDLYQETLRPQFHFSSRRGWLNDPNGLLYYDGLYHLYYQHNPLGTLHGGVNVCWGHAVSTDLIHWKERSDAVLPWRRDWLVGSGSALIDAENAAGYGRNTIIAAFTALGTSDNKGNEYPSGGQFIAASTDGGNSFYRFSQLPSVPTENGASWRDPRIFQEGSRFYMAVYERHNDINGVSFYVSDDLHRWEPKSWVADLYECPDIFPLRVDGSNEIKWVLYGANGIARIGNFKEGVFVTDGISFPLDYGDATYAGQTWNHEPKGRRVHIGWVRGLGNNRDWAGDMGYHGMPFSQCMTIPCVLTLIEKADGIRLCRKPIEEMISLRAAEAENSMGSIERMKDLPLCPHSESIIEFDAESDVLSISLGGRTILYEAGTKTLVFPGGKRRSLSGDALAVRMFVDATTLELFFNDEISATYAFETKGARIGLEGRGRLRIRTWKLSSIW